MTENTKHEDDKTEDLRVRRSRKMMQDALITLTVEKKGFTTVTVNDITERAMVNRSTFYRHYTDKCDMVCQYMESVYELSSTGDKVPVSLDSDGTQGTVPSGLLNLLKHLQEFAEFYRIMLSADGDPGFAEQFRQNLEKRFWVLGNQGQTKAKNSIPLDMRVQFLAHAVFGAIVWWLENDQLCSVEQLTSWVSRMVSPIWSGDIGD